MKILSVCLFVAAMLLQAPASAQEQTGKVYLMRATIGTAPAFYTFMDNELVCKTKNNKYSVHEVPAGVHSFYAQLASAEPVQNAKPIVIEIEEGKTYYFQLVLEAGVIAPTPAMFEVTENMAKMVMPELDEVSACIDKRLQAKAGL